MNRPREIEGREFDWFATDREGRIALFSTAGFGPAPESVVGNIEAHDAAVKLVPVIGWGSKAVWQSFARVGLYAYDWSDSQERYVRVAEPAASLPDELGAAVSSIPARPRLALSFTQATAVRSDWQEDA